MAFLTLTDDEIALLRYTCDLFFVEESPLHYIDERRAEPRDYETTYHRLVEKHVIDPLGFRVTDDALNRVAPVTECDGRVVYIALDGKGEQEECDFYLLDEIAVQHHKGENGHAFGVDMDAAELIDYIARRMVPRRASGDKLDIAFSATEFLAVGALLRSPRARAGIPASEARALLGRAPSTAGPATTPMLQVFAPRRTDPTMRRHGESERVVGDPTWDAAIQSLIEKSALTVVDGCIRVRARLVDFLDQRTPLGRHTVVRYDFGDGEWFMREVTFIDDDGALLWLVTRPDGGVNVTELDGESLKIAVTDAIGPLPRQKDAPPRVPQRRFPPPFDDDDDDATELALRPMASVTKVDPIPPSE